MKKKNRCLHKAVNKFEPFDWEYMLSVEESMIKEYLKFFTGKKHWAKHNDDVPHLKLALNLIKIIKGEDTALKQVKCDPYHVTKKVVLDWDFILIKYVNTRNFKRFTEWEDDGNVMYKNELRERKAWYLYHKLRYYFMKHWWD